jgi:hypothetical protein
MRMAGITSHAFGLLRLSGQSQNELISKSVERARIEQSWIGQNLISLHGR